MYFFQNSAHYEHPDLDQDGNGTTFFWVDFRETAIEMEEFQGAVFMGCIFGDQFFVSTRFTGCTFVRCLWVQTAFPVQGKLQMSGSICHDCNFDSAAGGDIVIDRALSLQVQAVLNHIRVGEKSFLTHEATSEIFQLMDGKGQLFLPLVVPYFFSDDYIIANNSFSFGSHFLAQALIPSQQHHLAAGVALLRLMLSEQVSKNATELFLDLQIHHEEAKRVLDESLRFVFQFPWQQPKGKKSWALRLANHLAKHSPDLIPTFPLSSWIQRPDAIGQEDWHTLFSILLECNSYWGLDDDAHLRFRHTIAPGVSFLITSAREQQILIGLKLIDRVGLPPHYSIESIKRIATVGYSSELIRLLNWVLFQFGPVEEKRSILKNGLLQSPHLEIFKQHAIYWEGQDGAPLFSESEVIHDLSQEDDRLIDHGLIWAEILPSPAFAPYLKKIMDRGHSRQSAVAGAILRNLVSPHGPIGN